MRTAAVRCHAADPLTFAAVSATPRRRRAPRQLHLRAARHARRPGDRAAGGVAWGSGFGVRKVGITPRDPVAKRSRLQLPQTQKLAASSGLRGFETRTRTPAPWIPNSGLIFTRFAVRSLTNAAGVRDHRPADPADGAVSSRPSSPRSARAAAGCAGWRKTATPWPPASCRSSKTRTSSTATSPPRRSASRCRA